MDEFEKKYGIEENEKVKAFHRSRRMFCIHKNNLFVAEPNTPDSHARWFEKEGWISKEKDKLMDNIVRGFVDESGNIYFYIKYNFEVNKNAESVFFSYLKELVEKLKLSPEAKILGGMIKKEPGERFPPRKEYGKVKDYL